MCAMCAIFAMCAICAICAMCAIRELKCAICEHTESANAKKMQRTECTENGVFNLNLRGILILYNQTTTQVQLQQLYSEIGAEWERSQWNYLYDEVSTSSTCLVF